MDRTGRLDGAVVVVTGAAQGIGAATARAVVDAGGSVVAADLRLDAAQTLSAQLGERASACAVDVTDSASVRALVRTAVERHGRLDGWVNNAGIVESALALDLDDDTWRRTMAVDLDGTFYGAREAGRWMTAHGGGSIVNISSIAAFRATRPEHHVAYDTAKAGVAHMARVLAGEWAAHGVRVNAVAPGYTNTAILAGVGASSPETMASWLSQVPQGRLIEPTEIAAVVVFLLSGDSGSITAQTIHADAGYTAW